MTIFGMDAIEYVVRFAMLLISWALMYCLGLGIGRAKGLGYGVGLRSHDKQATLKAMKRHGYSVPQICDYMNITTEEYDQILNFGHERTIGY